MGSNVKESFKLTGWQVVRSNLVPLIAEMKI
jgi:hypothetical protein